MSILLLGPIARFDLVNGQAKFYLAASGTAGSNATSWVTSLTIGNDGSLTCKPTYSDTVGGTNRDLYIDDTGLIGYVSSSRRYKENIEDLGDFTDKLYDLRPVSFTWKKDKMKGYGLIAEEVDEVLPDIVSYDNEGKPETVEYSRLIPMLLNEIQNLKAENETLKQSNEKTTAELDTLKARMDQIESALRKIGALK